MRIRNLAFCVLACNACGSAAAESIEEARRQLWSDYRQSWAQLAADYASQGEADAARAASEWLPALEESQVILFDPADLEHLAGLEKVDEAQAALRTDQAQRLFALAEEAAGQGQGSLALRLATETIREDPDHKEARRVLGYERVDERWLSSFEVRMRRSGNVWHDRYGWIKERDVDRYEAGLRPLGSRWIPAEQDAAKRRTMDEGWVVSTEHFQVTTNHGLEAGVALARRLESLEAIWRQLFADYWMSRSELRDVFTGRRSLPRRTRPHDVWYFRTRDEYNAALRREQPLIEITLGIYFDTHRRGYFFAGDDQRASTIDHEAVHQLFQESRRTARLIGRADNFWIIEGIATYFESLVAHDHASGGRYYTLGGGRTGRMPDARARLLEDGYYVSMAELVRLGKDELQRRPDLGQLYSQVAGLTTFLMHAENGRYRGAVVDYLSAVYSGRADEDTLAELTAHRYEDLDREYLAFLQELR